jgi:hypothetical protein
MDADGSRVEETAIADLNKFVLALARQDRTTLFPWLARIAAKKFH